MKTFRKSIWRFVLLLLSFTLFGCYSYISDEAEQKFQALDEPFTVTVYPVNVVLGGPKIEHDKDLARDIMTFLSQENLAKPILGTTDIKIAVQRSSIQPKMAKQSAIAFASIIKETGIETDYALLVEILCNSGETGVHGVHFYLSDKTGSLASGGLTNSKWEEFQEVQPHDRKGGLEVAKRMLHREWQRD